MCCFVLLVTVLVSFIYDPCDPWIQYKSVDRNKNDEICSETSIFGTASKVRFLTEVLAKNRVFEAAPKEEK